MYSDHSPINNLFKLINLKMQNIDSKTLNILWDYLLLYIKHNFNSIHYTLIIIHNKSHVFGVSSLTSK